MAVTTIKRVQTNCEWWYFVEDCNVDAEGDPGTGLSIKCFDDLNSKGRTLLSIGKEDALAIRDAINQLYPPE